MRMYFNLICEEMEIAGGKIIHIDVNIGNMEEVHKVVLDNMNKYSNAK